MFKDCISLTEITIPKTVTTIEEYAFKECLRLEKVYCKATTPPSIIELAFERTNNQLKIFVPQTAVEAYKQASGWSAYASRIVGYEF